jgi:microcin C transport system substrate-binding protein
MRFFSAGDWATTGHRQTFDSGELVKPNSSIACHRVFRATCSIRGENGFKDVRVRQALGLAMDYEWMNRQLFYNAYQRVSGLFGNTDCAASGLPGPEELALMEPWRKDVPATVFGDMVRPPRTDGHSPHCGRTCARRRVCLPLRAGTVQGRPALRNAKGQAFEMEYLDSNEGSARVVSPWARNLEKLGIKLSFRPVDFRAVPAAPAEV